MCFASQLHVQWHRTAYLTSPVAETFTPQESAKDAFIFLFFNFSKSQSLNIYRHAAGFTPALGPKHVAQVHPLVQPTHLPHSQPLLQRLHQRWAWDSNDPIEPQPGTFSRRLDRV